jgi:hypothetical protein
MARHDTRGAQLHSRRSQPSRQQRAGGLHGRGFFALVAASRRSQRGHRCSADDKTFDSRIDPAHIGAAGSLGGYTVIAVAGGITEPTRLQDRSPAADALCKPPPADSDVRQKRLAPGLYTGEPRQNFDPGCDRHRSSKVAQAFSPLPPGRVCRPFAHGRKAQRLVPVDELVAGVRVAVYDGNWSVVGDKAELALAVPARIERRCALI